MSQKAYLVIAGIVFLLIALGHLLRVIFGVDVVVSEIPIPMWASVASCVAMAYLAYEGFHLARSRGKCIDR